MRVMRILGRGAWIPENYQPPDAFTNFPQEGKLWRSSFQLYDGFGKLFLCSMYNGQIQTPVSIAINTGLITFLVSKRLEHSISAAIPLTIGKATHVITWRNVLNKVVSYNR